jgi:glycogen operon protein
LLEKHPDILRFTQTLIDLRLSMSLTQRAGPNVSLNQILRELPVAWHGTQLNQPDWSEQSHSLALTVHSLSRRHLFHIILNAYWEALEFELPPAPSGWKQIVDTGQESPVDIFSPEEAPAQTGNTCRVQPRSLVVLAARQNP